MGATWLACPDPESPPSQQCAAAINAAAAAAAASVPGPRSHTGGCFGQTRLCPGPDEMAVPCRRRVREAGGPGRLDRTSSVRPRALHRSGSASGSSFVARIALGQGRGGARRSSTTGIASSYRNCLPQHQLPPDLKGLPSASAVEAEPGLTLAEVHFLYWKFGGQQIN